MSFSQQLSKKTSFIGFNIINAMMLSTVLAFSANTYAHAEKKDFAALGNVVDISLLNDIQKASESQDFAGNYTYQEGDQMHSSRLIHVVDGEGVKQRLVTLDGEPREYIRLNDMMTALIPGQKIIIQDHSSVDRFPGFLIGEPKNLDTYYKVYELNKTARVAGRECNILHVVAKDNDRNSYHLCFDSQTKLLLDLKTISLDKKVLSQIMFTDIALGKNVDTSELVSKYDTKGWKVVTLKPADIDFYKAGWRIKYPLGFYSTMSMARQRDDHNAVLQEVVTDGLSSFSVFVQKIKENTKTNARGAIPMGPMNIYRGRIDNYWFTLVGAVPMKTLKQVAETARFVSQEPKKH